MRFRILLFLVAATFLFSCEQVSSSKPGIISADTKDNIKPSEQLTIPISKFIDTRYEYLDSTGHKLVIENSLPKGGLTYTSPLGIDYRYTVFWTRITSETADTFTFTMNCPSTPVKLNSSKKNSVRLYFPSDPMTTAKESLFNYGLDVDEFLDDPISKKSSLQQSIAPNGVSNFYVVTLFDKGIEGIVRAGLEIEGQELIYKINDLKLPFGQVNIANLELR